MEKPYQFEDMFDGVLPEEQANLTSDLEKVVSQAKVCLSSKDFEEYRKAYDKVEGKMITLMIAFTDGFMAQGTGDMGFYGAKMARMVTKLSDLKALLCAVQADVRKEKFIGQDNEEEGNA